MAVFLALLTGTVAGAAGWDRILPGRAWDLLARLALLALLGVMGLRLGTDAGVQAAAASLGVRAAVLAVATAGGALAAGWLGQGLMAPAPSSVMPLGTAGAVGDGPDGATARGREAMRTGLQAVAALGAGFAAGRAALVGAGHAVTAPIGAGAAGPVAGAGDLGRLLDPAATALLLALLALYGREFGRQWPVVRAFILSARWRLLLVPLVGGLGSLAGGLGAGWLMGISPREALAAAAAFGWYSLAGVLVDRLAGPAAGALAFLANVLRELLAVLAVPLLAPRLAPSRRWLLVLPGGATTMDTSLPVLAAATDTPTTALAFVHGLALSLVAPPLILWLAG